MRALCVARLQLRTLSTKVSDPCQFRALSTKVGGPRAPPVPPWQSMARKLRDAGENSKYLMRLSSRTQPEMFNSVEELEKEMQAEMASALTRTEDKLLARLMQLETIMIDVENARKARDTAALSAHVDKYNAVRDAAIAARRDMTIQRQACGFRSGNYSAMEDFYPIPGRLDSQGNAAAHDPAKQREKQQAQRRWEQAMSRPAWYFQKGCSKPMFPKKEK